MITGDVRSTLLMWKYVRGQRAASTWPSEWASYLLQCYLYLPVSSCYTCMMMPCTRGCCVCGIEWCTRAICCAVARCWCLIAIHDILSYDYTSFMTAASLIHDISYDYTSFTTAVSLIQSAANTTRHGFCAVCKLYPLAERHTLSMNTQTGKIAPKMFFNNYFNSQRKLITLPFSSMIQHHLQWLWQYIHRNRDFVFINMEVGIGN